MAKRWNVCFFLLGIFCFQTMAATELGPTCHERLIHFANGQKILRRYLNAKQKVELQNSIVGAKESLARATSGPEEKTARETVERLTKQLQKGYREWDLNDSDQSWKIPLYATENEPVGSGTHLQRMSPAASLHEPTVSRWNWLKERGWSIQIVGFKSWEEFFEIQKGVVQKMDFSQKKISVALLDFSDIDFDAEIVNVIARTFFKCQIYEGENPDLFVKSFADHVEKALKKTSDGESAVDKIKTMVSGKGGDKGSQPGKVGQAQVVRAILTQAAVVYEDRFSAEQMRLFRRYIKGSTQFEDYALKDEALVSQYKLVPELVKALTQEPNIREEWTLP